MLADLFISTLNKMACSITHEERKMLLITRSEASDLVYNYHYSVDHAKENDIEPNRVFREKLEQLKPRYFGNATTSNLTDPNAGNFIKYSEKLYAVIQKLVARPTIKLSTERLQEISQILMFVGGPEPYIRLLTTTFLDWAVYNWYCRNEASFTEELGDNSIENQTCGICDFKGHGTFYYSTAYGLELPVCENCLEYSQTKESESSSEYSNDEEASASEEEASASEEDEEDEEDEDEEDEDDSGIGSASETDASETEASETEASETEDEDEDYSASETEDEDEDKTEDEDETDDEGEKVYSCNGCEYEFRDGYKRGWKAAMKQIANDADYDRHNPPSPPECERCGRWYGLKKCGGSCGGLVSYCSSECQRQDWRAEHKYECSKH
jgi:hypothetical protein